MWAWVIINDGPDLIEEGAYCVTEVALNVLCLKEQLLV